MKKMTRLGFALLFLIPATSNAGIFSCADLNGDSVIDGEDLIAAQVAWGQPCANCVADLDNDGEVTVLDWLTVLAEQGGVCQSITQTELAGNALATYPFFEYVAAFNEGSPVQVAIDPTLFPQVVGVTGDIYIVQAKTFDDWANDVSLVDVTGDGPDTVVFAAGTIAANTFTVSGSNTLSSAAGLGLGHAYDVVLDLNQNGELDQNDLIDGLGEEGPVAVSVHGMYVVHDLTLPGPLAVTETNYQASAGTVTAGFESENIFYPTNIASMGSLPLLIVSHGNGHNFAWYDHVGNHMASYGYVVMSHANNTVPGVFTASTTTLEHTDAFLSQLANIDGGVLVGHVDQTRMVWLGHSRGGEGVAIAVDRIFDGDWEPVNYSLDDLALVSSIAPVDFLSEDQTHPHHINYHLWTGGADSDVNGCANCDLCQTFHLHDRAEGYRQSISLHGVGHGDFHNGGGSSVAAGPCLVGRADTHEIMKGHLLPLVKHYVEGNVPGRDFLWRQWERFKPIGAPVDPCVVVDLMYRETPGGGYFTVDDYQTESSTATSSSGGAVTFSVLETTEGELDDNNADFTDNSGDIMNGMTLGGPNDVTRGVVFNFEADSFYELDIVPAGQDQSQSTYLQFRACQVTRHALTNAALEDLTFTVTLRDGQNVTSSINIGSYGGGIEEPYQRPGCGTGDGWANEWETIRIRLTDFLNNGSGLDLADLAAVRFEFGPSFGSSVGRVGLDGIAFSPDTMPPLPGGLSISLEGVLPNLVDPGTAPEFVAVINGVNEVLVPGTARFHYRLASGAFTSVAMTPLGSNRYSASLPTLACANVPEFYFSAEGSINGLVTFPRTAPNDFLTVGIGVETVFFTENLDTDPGWTTEGLWAFGQPTGMGGEAGDPDPTSGFTGPFVYGYNLDGDYENNLPERRLTSPAIDITGRDSLVLRFQRWLSVESSQYDHAMVQVSNDGTNWTTVYENGATFSDGAWIPIEIDLTDVATPGTNLFLSWVMGVTDGSVIHCGWNIDDIELVTVSCE